MLRYLPSHNFFKMHERPVLNQLRLRPEKNRSRLQKTGLVQSGPVFCLSGRMMDRSRSRSFLKRQKDRDRTGLLITSCGGDRGEFSQPVGPDGWAVAGSGSGLPRPPPKAGDLLNFGKISKTQPLTFGPSGVFAGKKGAENKRETISRTNSSSNMFSMLSSQTVEASDKGEST